MIDRGKFIETKSAGLTPSSNNLAFTLGGGDISSLIGTQDWSLSPLGSPANWPQSLRSVVGLLLSSKFPMFVAWGPELGFLYNDAYAKLMGNKHPSALGQPFSSVWADIWADIAPLVDAALDGEASYHENLPLVTTRSGYEEQAYFTFSYSPVRDDNGAIAGMFCAVAETTQTVLDERRQMFRLKLEERLRDVEDANEITAIAAETIGHALGVGRVGYGEVDEQGQFAIVTRDWTNGSVRSIPGRHRLDDFGPAVIAELKAAQTVSAYDVTTDPRTREFAQAFADIETRSALTVPLVKGGQLRALLYLHHPKARSWTADETELVTEVAERTWAAVERSRAEQGLRQRESRLRAVFDQAAAGFARTDLAGKFLEVNDRYCEIVGRSRRELLSMRMQDLTHPDDLGKNVPLFDAAAGGGSSFEIEKRYIKPDGSTVWVRNSVNAIRAANGQVEGILAVSIDLTKKREAQARLRQSEEQLRLSLAAGRMVAWQYDLVSGIVTRSENADEIFGPGSDAEAFHMRMPEDDAEANRLRLEAAIAGTAPNLESEIRYNHPDGRQLWLLNQGQVVKGADGSAIAMHGVCIDVTARKEAELGLLALNETLEQRICVAVTAQREVDSLYRAYFENSPEALFVIGVQPDGNFVVEEINPANEASVGLNLEEIRGKRIQDILPAESAKQVLDAYQHVIETGTIFQYREKHNLTGVTQHWDTSIIPMRNEQGEITRLIGSSRDVTRQVVAEDTLRQSHKMEAMGQLTGGVAHDFNNLLTPIVGALDLLRRRGVGNEREQQLMEGAAQSANRAKTLVQRLLAFARRQPLQAVPVDIHALVQNMADLVDATTGPKVNVVVDIADRLPPAIADANQVEMALLNLAVNARDAMPDGGILRITAAIRVVEPDNSLGVDAGEYISLSVADTGFGMDDDVLSRAIEPFFSTKGVGKGTGLGLSMVHGLASQLGGGLDIQSRKGEGTSVTLLLPYSTTTEVDAINPDLSHISTTMTGTVLLVDDETLVRATIADMLWELGFDVVEADSAEQAIVLVRQGLKPRVLITDHLMPGITGPDLARKLRLEDEALKVLIVSGYAESEGITTDLHRITKPFLSVELAAALVEIL